MNPLSRCSKGYKKCIKKCHQAQNCHPCPYLKECCYRYCLTLPPGSIKEDPFVKCVESILKRHR